MSGVLCFGSTAIAQTTAAPAMPEVSAKPVVPAKSTAPAKVSATVDPNAVAPGKAGDVTVVEVQGARAVNRIDRQVYDVKSDVSSTNGSAADALNNVPSVAVDPDGTVSLRGKTNVQILVDGKPSAMLQGDNRGAALNAIPASDIESIEVINNPGAQFGNEGGGGSILNLVMSRNRRPGGFGVVNTNIGTGGRYNSFAQGSYNVGRFGVQGNIYVRHDGRNANTHSFTDRYDSTGALLSHTDQQSTSSGLSQSIGFNSALTYNLGDKDTLGFNLSYAKRNDDRTGWNHTLIDSAPTVFDPTGTANDYNFIRTSQSNADSHNYSWGGRFDHKGSVDGEIFKVDLRVSSSSNDGNSSGTNVYSQKPVGTNDRLNRQESERGNKVVDFTGDYERPVEKGLVKLGFKIATNKNNSDSQSIDFNPLDPQTPLGTSHASSNDSKESNLAVYGSYQLHVTEKWGVLGGLRVEKASIDTDKLVVDVFADPAFPPAIPITHFKTTTTAVPSTGDFLNYIPSFYATYKVSDDANMRFSYANRIRRPSGGDLSSVITYVSQDTVSVGNPNLKPTKTDKFEIGYETKFGTLDTNLRAYYNKDTNVVSDNISTISSASVSTLGYFAGPLVTLTSKDNSGTSKSGGLEFSLSGKITPGLRLNTSGNITYSELTVKNSPVDSLGQTIIGAMPTYTKRDAIGLYAQVRLRYQATEADTVQIALNARGKNLSAQGYEKPNATANFSVRHAVTPKLDLSLNVSDVFKSNKRDSVTDTATIKGTSLSRYDSQVVYIGFSYRFGGVTKDDKGDSSERGPRGDRGGRGPGGGGPGGGGGGGGFGGGGM